MDQRLRSVVGRRAKRLRVQAGRSLREQARRAGVSASALSQLENERGGLSLDRLQRLANDFGLSVTDLLGEEEGAAPAAPPEVEILRDAAGSTPSVNRGTGVNYQLLGPGAGHRLQPYMLSFAPGGGYGRDLMGHEGEEFSYVLVGAVDLLIGDEVHRLRQGDSARFRTERPHGFRNASKEGVAVVVGAATPPW